MTLTRDELEGRLRQTLRTHADTIVDEVPIFASTPIAASPHRPRRRLAAFVAAAASVALIAVGVAVVRASGDGGGSRGQPWTVHFSAFDRPQVAADALPADANAPDIVFRPETARRVVHDGAVTYWVVEATLTKQSRDALCIVRSRVVDDGGTGPMACGAPNPETGLGELLVSSYAQGASLAMLVPDRASTTVRAGPPGHLVPVSTEAGLYHREWAAGQVPGAWAVSFERPDGTVTHFAFAGQDLNPSMLDDHEVGTPTG
jgi:hypothetical protein